MIISFLRSFGQPAHDLLSIRVPDQVKAEIFRKANSWAGIYQQINPGSVFLSDMRAFTISLKDTLSFRASGKDSLLCSTVCEIAIIFTCADGLAELSLSTAIQDAPPHLAAPSAFFNPNRKGYRACYQQSDSYFSAKKEVLLQNWKTEMLKKAASLKADW